MENLQNELVVGFITDDRILAAKGDIEALKREIEDM